MAFPATRPRRLRASPVWRDLVAETQLRAADLVSPLFVIHGTEAREPVLSMPGVARLSVDLLVEEARAAHALGVPAVMLFGIPEEKDALGSAGYAPNGVVPQAIRALERELPELLVWADVCLLRVSEAGRIFVRNVCMAFDRYLEARQTTGGPVYSLTI